MQLPRIDPGIVIGLDYETTGLEYWQPDFRVLGVAVAVPRASWYFDIRTTPGLIPWLKDLLNGREAAAHNAQYEVQCTRVLGIDPRKTRWWCTMVHACLIDEHQLTYNLISVAGQAGVDSQKAARLEELRVAMGWATTAEVLRRMADIPSDTPALAAYATSDAEDALAIRNMQVAEVDRQNLEVVSHLEMDLLPVLADMSWTGIRVDLQAAHDAIPKLDAKELTYAAEIKELTGCANPAVFVNSSKQMREFFKPEPISKFQWRLIDGTIVGPTKGGASPSLNQDAMREIQHPLAQKVLGYRKTLKLRDTFIRGHVIGSADGDGYVHTQFNQARNDADAGTITGRLSSTDPALQQITARDKENAKILRSLFLPDDGDQWMCADYNQVDFRCGAHLQNDPMVLQAYAENPKLDYHQVVSDMTGIPRNPPYAGAPNTKQINLGLSFGAGQGKLAFMMKMPYEVKELRGKMSYVAGPEAAAIFNLYHSKLPAVKKFMEKASNVAKQTNYVKTATGRRLRFPRGMGAHKAAGLLYQAYAADVHKYGLVKVDRLIREQGMSARLMMSCHDEIGVSMQEDPEVRDMIVREYTDFSRDESPIRMRVPILASGDFGPNWYEASK